MKFNLWETYSVEISENDKTVIHMLLAFLSGVAIYGIVLALPMYVLWNYFLVNLVNGNVLNHLKLIDAFAISMLITLQMKMSSWLSFPKYERPSRKSVNVPNPV